MGNLLTSLLNSANALQVYSQALEVTQNNVTNSSTPGYAKQTQVMEALPFDITVGLPGGVRAGPVVSSRNAFAEQAVQQQQSALGSYKQRASDLSAVETSFDLTSQSGIAGSLSSFFQSCSQLSINPNDTVSRQAVIDQATRVSQSFQRSASSLLTQNNAVERETRTTIDAINRLAATIGQINSAGRKNIDSSTDAGIDAKLHSTLEELSQLTGFNALEQPDGTVTIYLNGQAPLVVGDRVYQIQGDFSTAQTQILDASGQNITSQFATGQLSGLIDVRNNVIPSYISDLNSLAQNVADQVNGALAAGLDQNGGGPVVDLFRYDAPGDAALTLSVTNITPDQIAAALPDAPGGNGNALNLVALGDAKNINGYSYAQFYGNLAGRVGRDLSAARDDQSTQEGLLSQTQDLRSRISSVSLDEEATQLIAFQRAYQAMSKMLSILNDLTGTVINIIPPQ